MVKVYLISIFGKGDNIPLTELLTSYKIETYRFVAFVTDVQHQQLPPLPRHQPLEQRVAMVRLHRQQHLQLKERHDQELSAQRRRQLREWEEVTRCLGRRQDSMEQRRSNVQNVMKVARRQRQQHLQLKEQHSQELDAQMKRRLQEWKDQERHLRQRLDGMDLY